MPLTVIKTKDGSSSLFISELNETYHSIHGALQESLHVYIKNGFELFSQDLISVLEVGLGTGLNAALTWQMSESTKVNTHYFALEPFPLTDSLILEISKGFDDELSKKLIQIHQADWEHLTKLSPFFHFTKYKQSIQNFGSSLSVDLIYMDAFAPDKQPEMWTLDVISKLSSYILPKGALTTYCAKGDLKRNLKVCGLTVNSVPGPIGKREMIVARKISY